MAVEDDDSPTSQPSSPASPSSSTTAGRSPSKVHMQRLSTAQEDEINAIDTEARRLSRRRSSHNLRNYGTFMAQLRDGETVLEKELDQNVHSPAPSPRLEREEVEEEQKRVMARRGLQRRPTQLYVKFDNFAETLFISNFETPWFLSSCVDHPLYQQLCNPAEYATRTRRENLEAAAFRMAGTSAGDERMFNLPPFAKAGFHIMSPEEARLPDDRVSRRLGLNLAVHRKTSVERLVLKIEKTKLPPYVKEEQISALVKNLKRCDHVNVLNCKEVCEDQHYLYFLHENFPCVTLLSQLENVTRKCSQCPEREVFDQEEIAEKTCKTCEGKLTEVHNWTHEHIVNIARECYAATAYCSNLSLPHLGWTLCHVLLPVTCLNGDPMVSKIFGFGHMGILHTECNDRTCWAPEAVGDFARLGDAFAMKMEASFKTACDNWSLGVITYTLIAKRPPMVGKGQVVDEQILSRKWVFSPIFDEVDVEAKALVESFLQGIPEKRMKPEAAIRNEWLRRRWKPPPNGNDVYIKLEEFCRTPLSKRLFGRFLVGFLDAEYMRQIAISFYALDAQGDGVISYQDLRICAKHAGRPVSSAKLICDWLCPGAENISLSRFAESMAEEIIDGRALRHAFEKLDENGSEEITPEELFYALSAFDDDLTMAQVMDHINEAEKLAREQMSEVAELKGHDHQIDFEEFQGLFPVRMERVRELQDRHKNTRESADTFTKQFQKVERPTKKWIREVEEEQQEMQELKHKLQDRKAIDKTAKEVTKCVKRIADKLRLPPGPHDIKKITRAFDAAMMGAAPTKKPKKGKGEKAADLLHFDSFMQDYAVANLWHAHMAEETRNMKAAMQSCKRDDQVTVDYHKAVDVCHCTIAKLDQVLQVAKGQMEEKQLTLQVLRDLEAPMPAVTPTCRGLPKRRDAEWASMAAQENSRDDANICTKLFTKLKCFGDKGNAPIRRETSSA